MTPDDSPALGGQADDDAPMISSVQTRVIADARGAYLAGNLDALIGRLSPAQQLAFRQAVVRQCIHTLEQRLVPDLENDQDAYKGLHFARRWLDDPDSVNVEQAKIAALGEIIDGGVRYHDYHEVFLEPIFLIAADDLSQAARHAIHAVTTVALWAPRGEGAQEIIEAARRWQVEAAWAILRDQPIPALETP
jgi:hypothetical protein